MLEEQAQTAYAGHNCKTANQCGAVQGAQRGDALLGACSTEARTIRASVDVPAHHDFSTALRHLMQGHRATRAGWNAGGQHVEAQFPDKGSRMSVPYLVLKNAQNDLVPWVPSQGDLFATDWAVLPR